MWDERKPGMRLPETEQRLHGTTENCQITPHKLLSLNQDIKKPKATEPSFRGFLICKSFGWTNLAISPLE
jgi:hypothetical protein